MTRRVVYTVSARRDLRRLDRMAAARVMDKMDALAAAAGIKNETLRYTGRGLGRLYKLRVGAYRVIYSSEGQELTVHAIGHRSEIYKILKG